MLYAISKGRVDGYDKEQDHIVYIVTNIDNIVQARLRYVFTDGHAIMGITNFYNNLNNLDQIDWEVMNAKYWADTEDDPDQA